MAAPPPPPRQYPCALVVDKPDKVSAQKNRVWVHATDFEALRAASPPQSARTGPAPDHQPYCLVHVRTDADDVVLLAAPGGGVAPGRIGLAGLDRKELGLEMGAAVTASPFDPGRASAAAGLRVSLRPVAAKPAVVNGRHAHSVLVQYDAGLVVKAGQSVGLVLVDQKTKKRVACAARVEGWSLAHLPGAPKPRETGYAQLLEGVTTVLGGRDAAAAPDFIVENEALAEGEGEEVEAAVAPTALFNSEFDFAKLGIGGLGAEFDKIFRRAFASRIYPAHIIKQMGIQHVRGMLLYGPPGCGKTLIARQIGKVLNSHEPKIVNGPEVLDKYVGASEEKIRELFAAAEQEQKDAGDASMLHTIIFDEMDAICKSRGSVRDGTGVSDSIVNQLLSKIDGVDSLNNILVIGMTNRKDMIDEAILRPGRLELHVEIGLPDEKGRLQILEIKTADMRKAKRLEAGAVDALPEFAARTKNFSGAELEGLVKSAASYALRRCVDVAEGNKIDDAALKVRKGDFDHALDSGEAVAAFGAKAASLEPLYRNGIVDFGPQFRDNDDALKRLIEQVRTSAKTPLMTVLLEGGRGTGKTALAAHAAVRSEFPFVRLLSADTMIGFSESAKCQAIQKVFMDSYKSPLSIVIVDDVERLIEYAPVGPRFSNTVLQTLLVLLKKAPEDEGRRLMVIGTTAIASQLEDLQLVDAFNVPLRCPQLEAPAEIEAALADLVTDPKQRAAVAAMVTRPLGIKQLLMCVEMARDDAGGVDANDFAACYHQFLT